MKPSSVALGLLVVGAVGLALAIGGLTALLPGGTATTAPSTTTDPTDLPDRTTPAAQPRTALPLSTVTTTTRATTTSREPQGPRGSEPTRHGPDVDGDGLPDPQERSVGTDPRAPDTDGDGLLDGEELRNRTRGGAPLPDADPAAMDLYLTFVYHENTTAISPNEARQLRDIWSRKLHVDNPDGSTGVDLHLLENDVPAFDRTWSPTNESMNWFRDTVYERLPASARGAYKMVIVGPDDDALVTGAYFADGTGRRYALQESTDPESITHELLHMILGELDRPCGDDPYHTCEGLMSRHRIDATVQDRLVEELQREGIPR